MFAVLNTATKLACNIALSSPNTLILGSICQVSYRRVNIGDKLGLMLISRCWGRTDTVNLLFRSRVLLLSGYILRVIVSSPIVSASQHSGENLR